MSAGRDLVHHEPHIRPQRRDSHAQTEANHDRHGGFHRRRVWGGAGCPGAGGLLPRGPDRRRAGPGGPRRNVGRFLSREKAIELISFDWSAENPASIGSASGGAGTGKAKLNRLTVEKRVDSASAALFQRIATGAHFPSMELFVRRAGATGAGHLKYRFTTVFVSSVSPSGDGEQMRERVTFEYGAVAQSYTQQTAHRHGWHRVRGGLEPGYEYGVQVRLLRRAPGPKRCESRN